MKRPYLYLIFVFLLLASCKKAEIKTVSLEGELYAKNLIKVAYDFSDMVNKPEYSWYIAPSPDGEWQELQGILTDEIILLTSYIGNYLKCEITISIVGVDEKITASIVSPDPIEDQGNPNTDWFRDAGFGIMIHYLKPAIVPEGGAKEWNDAVNSFSVETFARQAHEAGVGYVMFTLGQNSGYYCSPNSVFEHIVGVAPGELCSIRDLPMDLLHELDQYNIPLILYLPSNPPVNNKLVSQKFHYPLKDTATSQFNQPILEDMIREWSLRYGPGVKGWWFDGLYSWNAIKSTRMDMSLNHNISTHTLAAKAGNKQSIVTYNYGFGEIQVNTPYCDYSSGEKRTIDEFPKNRWVKDGVQWFLFTYLGEKWGGKGLQFETDDLVAKADRITQNGGVLCLEVVTDARGEILPHHHEQIKAVGKKLGRVR